MINPEALRRVIDEQGVLAVVQIKQVQVQLGGTRSEHVEITAETLDTLFGAPRQVLQLRRYTSKGDTLLRLGCEYVVAAVPNPRYGDAMQLEDFVPTSDNQRAESAAQHRALVQSVIDRGAKR